MEPLSRADLAQRAAKEVATVAGELVRKLLSRRPPTLELMKNLGELASSLMLVSFNQDKYHQEEHQYQQEDVAGLEKFLRGLELVCTVRSPTTPYIETLSAYYVFKFPNNYLAKTGGQPEPSARFPTLNALIQQSVHNFQLTAGVKIRLKIDQSVEAFAATSPDRIDRYVKFLNRFFETEKQAKKQAHHSVQRDRVAHEGKDTMTAKSEDDESYPRHVYKSLYKVIERYAECCFCGLSDPSPTTPRKSHWGRLELKGKYPTIENEILFHSVFSKKGLIEFVGKVEWQHFTVPRLKSSKKQKLKSVGFEDEKNDECNEASAKPDYAKEITSTSEFCKLLSEDIGPASKDVRIGDEVLLVFNHAVGIEVDIADERSLPLTDVLGQYSLVPKTKLLLAYILAKSVWQFYNSDFMSVWWTPESIHLFRERETEEVDDEEPGVDWAPYYAFSSKQPQGEHCEERLKHGYFIHRYPRVLALGLLLYEIGRKRRRGSRTTISPTAPVEFPTIAKIINATSHKINIGMGKKEWPDIKLHDPEALANYQLVVKNCVDPSFFKPILQKGSLKTPEELEEELTIEERRAILYRKVVEPLKKLVQSAGWVDESGSIERRHVKGAAARKKEEPISQNTGSAKLLHPPQDFSDMTQDTYTALEAKAKAWLDEIKKSPVTATVLSAFEVNNEPEVNRIRIVVLDTGYDPNAIFFVNKQRTRRLKGWKDYVETDQPDPKDEDGHGTHVVSVLMKVAPAADIYFARVARGSRDLEKAAGNVAEAIEWAWKDCEADIVTMSFGFHEEIYIEDKPVISNAILEALRGTDQRILFFAAAANDGGNRQEMFPASDMHVLSIRGTDEYGWAQPFNPPPDYNGKTCFMTLGIQVPGASLCSSEDGGADVCRNGTSVATPIAAGIAAMLLGYTRIYEEKLREILGREDEAKLVRIWNITGMSMLFEKMASKMDNKCSFLHINKLTERSHRMRLGLIADAAKEATG